MRKTMLAWAVMLVTLPASAQNTGNLLNEYISVKDALAVSDSKAASEAAGALYRSINAEGSFTEREELLKATGRLSKAGNIGQQRAALNDVSVVLWKLVKNDAQIQAPVYYQYCPMKKAYWLSREQEIRNPYYGASMLTCGKVAEAK